MRLPARGNIPGLRYLRRHLCLGKRGPLRYGAGQGVDLSQAVEAPLLGRASELEQLTELLALGGSGRGGLAWIEGEPGIGKSRLLAEALTVARDRGFQVFTGTADELERGRPFGPLLDALAIDAQSRDERRRDIARLISVEPDQPMAVVPGAVADVGYQVIESLLSLLEETAARAPLALALEDLHWADPSTLRALRMFRRHLSHLPIVVFATLRPAPRIPELERLVETAEGAIHVTLDPLGSEAIAGLTERIVAAPPGITLLDQVAGAAGNPLYVIELLRALRDEGAIEVKAGRAEANAAPRPPTLRLTILRRISFLSEETLEILRWASILGSSFSLTDLASVTSRTAGELLAPIREAVRAGLIVDAEKRLVFRHDLIRESIYEDLPPAVRIGLHLDAARALEAAGAPALQVAEHLFFGASPGDTAAADRLRKSARALVILAPAVAARLLERALQLLPPSAPLRQSFAADLLMPLYFTGRLAEADALVREILAGGAEPELEYLARRSLAYSLLIRGQPAAAVDEYRIVTKTIAPALEESAEASHAVDLTNLALSLFSAGDLGSARAPAEEALVFAEQARSDYATSLALQVLALMSDAEGRVQEALDLARRVFRIENRAPGSGNFWAHFGLGIALTSADRLTEGESALRTGLRLVEDQARLGQLPFYHLGLELALLHAGRWDDALAECEALLSVPDEAGAAANVSGRAIAAYIAFHRGDLGLAARALDEAERDMVRTGPGWGLDLAAFCRAMLLESEGKVDEALALASGTWDLTAAVRYGFGTWRTSAPEIVRLSLDTGVHDRAQTVTEEAEEGARRAPGVASAEGAALRCRGLLERDPAILLRAAETFRAAPRPVERALACQDAAVALASNDRVAEAVPLFEEALEVFESVGASRDIARARAELRRFGIRRGSRRTRRRPATGWDSLTPTEREAVRLVAEGLPNAEIAKRMFISRYTVETHLKHVYAKLGIPSRTELAAEAVRRFDAE